MLIHALFNDALLGEMRDEGYVRIARHPTAPLLIANYTQKAAYEGVWNDVTLNCRGLIYDANDGRVIARPFPKFFTHGQLEAADLDLAARVRVSDKLDGSLGILYPAPDVKITEHLRTRRWSIATRGSFTSEQALHASTVLLARYADWKPFLKWTYLFEIVYPENRVVIDYEGMDDIVLLDVLDTETGVRVPDNAPVPDSSYVWRGPRVETFDYATLADALAAEPRPNREGFVVYFPDTNARVKIKQDDYLTLHRILTELNARNVWEVAAVQSCRAMIHERNHWATYLGISPARAEEVLALGDDWLAAVPDEFFDWVKRTDWRCTVSASSTFNSLIDLAARAAVIENRRERYEYVAEHAPMEVTETMRVASAETETAYKEAAIGLYLMSWRRACPEPTSPWTPWTRTEHVA